MKNILLILSVSICFLAASCSKQSCTGNAATGVITGYDLSNCVCCGGYVIKLNGSANYYHFYNFPAGSKIDSTHFPINVVLTYENVTTACSSTHLITVTSISKVD